MESWSPKIGCNEEFWFDLFSPNGDYRKVCARYGHDPSPNSDLCQANLCPIKPNSQNWPGKLSRAAAHLEHGRQNLEHYNSSTRNMRERKILP